MTRNSEDRAAPRGRPLLFAAALVAVVAILWWLRGGGGERDDVVIITIDTLRADPSKADMPVLHRLAAQGIHCAGARTVSPLTLPAHASLFTGRTPAVHGLRDNTASPLAADRDFTLLAEEFREAGYATAAFVASAVLDRRYGLDAGFDHYEAPEATPGKPQFATLDAAEQVSRVRRWLAQEKSGKPRFVWIHLWEPHAPYRPYAGDPLRPRATKADDLPVDRYWGEVRRADAALGSLTGMFDVKKTHFVVTSDHGEGLGEHGEPTHGFLVYGATMDIPLVLTGPGIPPGRQVPAPSSILDVAPTLRELCGLTAQTTDGVSLLKPPRKRVLVGESLYGNRLYGWAQLSVATDGRFTLVDGGRRLELFDRERDPREEMVHRDPASHPAYARLDRALLDYQQAKPAEVGALSVENTPYGALRRPVAGFLPRAENRKLADVAASLPVDRLVNRMRTAIAAKSPPVVERLLGRMEDLERKDPANPAPSLERGRALLLVLARYDEAVSALEEAKRRGYRSQDLDRLIALARSRAAEAAGDRSAALRILEEAVKAGLGNPALEKRIRELGG
ncbi:MAG: sulfatase-like hydrolase/transferase [Planctomycetota bacterium]